jgi:multimeric flavodoxin WrbA
MLKSVVIFGSARSNGNTGKALDLALTDYDFQFIDLSKFIIHPFDYDGYNSEDDFISLMNNILEYDRIFFTTPIYWYGPSTIMKIFLDRWSDILKEPYKKIGKAFVGKEVFIISSNGVSPSECFEDMFKQICQYMNMQYVGCYNYHSGSDEQQILQSKHSLIKFREKIASYAE